MQSSGQASSLQWRREHAFGWLCTHPGSIDSAGSGHEAGISGDQAYADRFDTFGVVPRVREVGFVLVSRMVACTSWY